MEFGYHFEGLNPLPTPFLDVIRLPRAAQVRNTTTPVEAGEPSGVAVGRYRWCELNLVHVAGLQEYASQLWMCFLMELYSED